MEEKKPQRVLLDISWTALFKILGLALAIWAVLALRDIIIMVFIVFIFVGAINPIVAKLQQKMARVWAVALIYLVILLLISAFIYLFVPPLVAQVNELTGNLPKIFNNLRDFIGRYRAANYGVYLDRVLNSVTSGLSIFSGNIFDLTIGIFGGLATFFTGLVLSFYLLLEEKNARDFFYQVLPKHRFEAIYITVIKISDRMGSWARGQLVVMGILALANLILFVVLRVPSPLPLSLWTGLMELIPYLGPILGLIPAFIVTIATGGIIKALILVVISVAVIHQTEGQILVPKLMGKAVGLSPVLVILALTSGFTLYGLVGAIISIPAAAAIAVVVGEWPNLRKLWSKESGYEEAE